jgi:hypothetical protein
MDSARRATELTLIRIKRRRCAPPPESDGRRPPVTADRPPLTVVRLNPAAEIAGQGQLAMTRPGGTA